MDQPAAAKRILLVGAGGHARVCLESLQDGDHLVVGAVSLDGGSIQGLGVQMLGTEQQLESIVRQHAIDAVFLGIGDNAARANTAQLCQAIGLTMVTAISRFAMISRSATVRDGAAVMPGAVVNAATTIGVGAVVNTNASVDHDCVIGDFAHIAPGVAIAGGVTVSEGVFVGIGARVLPNLTIGARALIGGGAVVVSDVAPGAKLVGVPGRVAPERRP